MSNREKEIERFKSVVDNKVTLSSECWDVLLNSISTVPLSKNAYFSKELSRTTKLAFIIEGVVRIYSVDEEGLEWNHSILSSDEFIMASINPNIPSPVNIQAISPTRLLSIRYSDFAKLAKVYSELNDLAQTIITAYLDKESNRNKFLMTKKSSDRLAYFNKQFEHIIDQIPPEHIAKYIGVSEEKLESLLTKT